MHGLARKAPAIAPARLHLAEDEQIVFGRDDIQLALRAPVVTVEDCKAHTPVQRGREILARAAQPTTNVHDGRAYGERVTDGRALREMDA